MDKRDIKFRALSEIEVEARVGGDYGTGLTLLLYKDARCDMNVLDETVGAFNWQRKHYECKGNLYCSVGIKTEGGWVWKDDCGAESYTEKEKGEASDSFKRACVNWGIGRELYTSPLIWIPLDDKDGNPNYKYKEKGGKKTVDARFTVTGLASRDGRITALMIENSKLKKTVFKWGIGK